MTTMTCTKTQLIEWLDGVIAETVDQKILDNLVA